MDSREDCEANALNLVHQQIKNPKLFRMKLWTSEFDVKNTQNDPGNLIFGFALKNYAQKWSQIEKCWMDDLKTRVWHLRPIIENPGLNVNDSC